MPFDVAKLTVTVDALAADNVTVNVNGVVPLLPSFALTLLIDRVGVGGGGGAAAIGPY